MKLEDLKKVCDEATPGPWAWTHDFPTDAGAHLYGSPGTPNDPWPRILDDGSAGGEYAQSIETGSADALFIAAARSALPKLIAVAEAAKTVRGHPDWCELAPCTCGREATSQALADLEAD